MKQTVQSIAVLILIFASHYFANAQQVMVSELIERNYRNISFTNHVMKNYDSGYMPGDLTLKDGTKMSGKLCFYKKDNKIYKVKVKTGGPDSKVTEINMDDVEKVNIDYISVYKRYNNFPNPVKNFQKGYIITLTGEKLEGKVAIDHDWGDFKFFTTKIYFLSNGQDTANAIRGRKLLEAGQEMDGKMTVYDGYADGYLLRIADGHLRLSRNPYPTSLSKFATHSVRFVAEATKDSAAVAVARASYKSNRDINNAVNNSNAVYEIMDNLGSIEIHKKEYLIYNKQSRELTAVNNNTFENFATHIAANCDAFKLADANAKKDLIHFDNIEMFVEFYNEKCK